MTETKKRDWGWLGYVGTAAFGAAVAVIIMLSCGKKDTPEGVLIYERSLDGRVVNIWKKVINGIAQKIEYKEVKPDTEYLLDTVYFPKQITKLWGIGSFFYNSKPLPSAIFYRDTNGTASAMQFMANLEIAGALRITIDSAGKPHIEEAPINLQPKVKRTVLSVGISGGVQYGQVDTLWKFSPEFGAGIEWTPFKSDWFALYAGLGWDGKPKAEIETRFKIPILTKE